MMIDYYELLGVDEGADKTEIKRAYFKKVRQYTPEKDPEMFAKIREAYDFFKNADSINGYKRPGKLPDDDRLALAGKFLEEHNFKDGIKTLKEISESHPKSESVKLMLGGVYEQCTEFGNASKVYEGLCKEFPGNQEYAVAYARCLYHRSYNKKAHTQFERAVGINTLNADAWAEWVYTVSDDYRLAEKTINMAEAFSKDMFKERYEIYATVWLNDNRSTSYKSRHLLEKFIEYYEKEDFPNKKRVTLLLECTREALIDGDDPDMEMMRRCIELVNGNVDSENKQKVNYLVINYGLKRLEKSGVTIDGVLHDLTIMATEADDGGDVAEEMNAAKTYIIAKFSKLRGQIIYFKDNYPELYVLNADFFERTLDAQKRKQMENRIRRMLGNDGMGADLSSVFSDDILIDAPFKRETPKVGRNDPCPCGSGRKHKKCCGA